MLKINKIKEGETMGNTIPIPKGYEGMVVGENNQTIMNPYTGQECELTPVAVAVYDVIKGAEAMGLYNTVRVGLDWFKKYYTKEYMVLLD